MAGRRSRIRSKPVCTWDVFPSIFRAKKNGLRVHRGWKPLQEKNLTDRERALNETMELIPHYWPDS